MLLGSGASKSIHFTQLLFIFDTVRRGHPLPHQPPLGISCLELVEKKNLSFERQGYAPDIIILTKQSKTESVEHITF